MADREIDWRAYLNRLTFCHGCGRLGLPPKGRTKPRGWKLLYQPHPDGSPGLRACSQDCQEALRLAMMRGPITEPLAMPEPGNVVLPAEVKQAMLNEVRAELEAEHGGRSKPVPGDPEGEGEDGGNPPAL